MPSAPARPTIEAMIAPFMLPFWAAPRTKLWSILILSNGHFLQIAKRRIAGAEIIKRQPHAGRLQTVEDVDIVVAAVQEHAFGHLELQLRGSKTVSAPGR